MEMSGQFHDLPSLTPFTHCMGGRVRPRAGVNDIENRKSLATTKNWTPAIQAVARRYKHSAIPESRCEFWGSQCDEYQKCDIPECDAVQSGR
jgi:hypothetical protein